MSLDALRYEEHAPGPGLARHVRCLWTLTGQTASAGPQVVMPDGCAELVVHVGGTAIQLDGHVETPQPSLALVGELRRPVTLAQGGAVDIVGVRLLPGTLGVLFREPAARLVDTVLDVEALVEPAARKRLRALRDDDDPRRRVALLRRWLRARVRASMVDDRAVRRAVARLVVTGGRIAVDDVATDLGISRRHLERSFLQQVGVAPKALAKVLRFQRAWAELARGTPIASVAAACGYADQAHLSRECRVYAGEAPLGVLARDNTWTALFGSDGSDGQPRG